MNLILITIDCLRADHLGCLGYPKKTTPNLDYLASKGMLFSQAISTGHMTPSSFASIFGSTFPLMNGGWFDISKRGITLPQVLKGHGYHTAAFHSNPWLSSYFGYQQGFDTFDDGIQKVGHKRLLNKARKLAEKIIGPKGRLADFLSGVSATLVTVDYYTKGDELNKKAIAWLQDNPNNFFLWIHYMDAHEPYYQPSQKKFSPFKRYRHWKLDKKAMDTPHSLLPGEVNELIDLYDAKISYVDKITASLLRTLKPNDMSDNTFVVITADHGQQFMEHGNYGHDAGLYDELIHVPLVIAGPGLKRQLITRQVSLLDLAPTILDMLKIEKPRAFLGDSLLPLIRGRGTKGGNLGAISETDIPGDKPRLQENQKRLNANRRVVSFRTGKWKYIHTEGRQDELYHLEDDPKETQNIIDAQPDIATELRAKIMAHIEFEHRSTPGERESIKARVRKLKDSGKI